MEATFCILGLDFCVLAYWGRGEGGLEGIGVSESGYNEVPALGMLNVVDCVERGMVSACEVKIAFIIT